MIRYYIKKGKQNIHITEWGTKDKPVIVCIHGLGSTSLSFIEVANELQTEFNLIAIDLPGHGHTTPFECKNDYESPNLAKWLKEILYQLEINDHYLLSHSWGSALALFYQAAFPEEVNGNILIDGGYYLKRLRQETMEEEADYYEEDFDGYIFEDWERFAEPEKANVNRWSPLLDEAIKDLGVELNNKVRWHALGKTARHVIEALHNFETEEIYEKLPSDITILRSTLPISWNDYRSRCTKIFKEKTGGSVLEVPETSHMLHWDKPEVVVAEVRKQWLSDGTHLLKN
jgi:pimeloyl-ACP methyl ester carboxylesterase